MSAPASLPTRTGSGEPAEREHAVPDPGDDLVAGTIFDRDTNDPAALRGRDRPLDTRRFLLG